MTSSQVPDSHERAMAASTSAAASASAKVTSSWLVGHYRLQKLECFEDFEVLIADRVAASGDDVPMVGEGIAGQNAHEPVGRCLFRKIELEFVHGLEVPGGRAPGAIQLECHLALGAEDRSVDLEGAPNPVFEFDQRSHVVLVGHAAGRVTGRSPVVVRARPWFR